MKIPSACLLLLSASSSYVAAGSNVRGAGREAEEETHKQQRDLNTFIDGDRDFEGGGGRLPDPVIDGPGLGGPGLGGPGLGGDDDPLSDVRTAAEDLNLSFDDAKELLQQQSDFAKLVDDLQGDIHFLQAEMPEEPNGQFVLRYKNGKVPPESKNAIDDFVGSNARARVEIVPSKLSLADAEVRSQSLADELEEKGYSSVSFSIDGDELEITAKKPQCSNCSSKSGDIGRTTDQRAAEILGRTASRGADGGADDGDLDGFALFLVEDDDEDPAEPYQTYGGRRIYRAGVSQCTTAFSVIKNDGTTGISTAAHCTGMNRYDPASGSDYPTYFQKEHRGRYGDVEWHTTTRTEPAEYYAWPNTRWPVRSVAHSVSKNQVVCGYSRMRGTRWCDRVYRTSVSVKYSGHPRMYNLVAMRNNLMIGGDSGGPWSYYDRAFGVVSGWMSIWSKRRDVWSRVSYMCQALDVMVRTQ